MSERERVGPLSREAIAWKLPGAGMYGSDVDVVSLDAYKELAARCENAEKAALMWGRKCIELEGRDPSEFDRDALGAIARSLRLPVAAILDAWSEPETAGAQAESKTEPVTKSSRSLRGGLGGGA